MGKQSKDQSITIKQLRQSAYWAIQDAETRAIDALNQDGTWMTISKYHLGLQITVAPAGQDTLYLAQDVDCGTSSGWTNSPYYILEWITAQYGWLMKNGG